MAATTPDSKKPIVKLYWWAPSFETWALVDEYRLNKSRSQRVLWLLEELNVPYELEIYHRDEKTRLAPPELKVHTYSSFDPYFSKEHRSWVAWS